MHRDKADKGDNDNLADKGDNAHNTPNANATADNRDNGDNGGDNANLADKVDNSDNANLSNLADNQGNNGDKADNGNNPDGSLADTSDNLGGNANLSNLGDKGDNLNDNLGNTGNNQGDNLNPNPNNGGGDGDKMGGNLGDNGDNPNTADNSNPNPNPYPPLICGAMTVSVAPSIALGICHRQNTNTAKVAKACPITTAKNRPIRSCHNLNAKGFVSFVACQTATATQGQLIAHCQALISDRLSLLHANAQSATTAVISYKNCTDVRFDKTALYRHYHSPHQRQAVLLYNAFYHVFAKAINHHHCHRFYNSDSVSIISPTAHASGFYPYRPDSANNAQGNTDNAPNTNNTNANNAQKRPPCPPLPPAHRLPLPLIHKTRQHHANALPVPLSCWYPNPAPQSPNLRSYIVHNVITASVGGIPIEPLSFSIKTDMGGYCWQGDVEISAKDFGKIKATLDAPHGQEPIINVVINGFVFTLIAEDITSNRQFANHTHTLSGRSNSARLGADYAKTGANLVSDDSYASQIVNDALANLPFDANFGLTDWLIPVNTYATTNKTPIAVIGEIANACGGFVASDESKNTLYLKPIYKVSAWELKDAKPDCIIPLDVIKSISEQKRVKTRYNSVVLTSPSQGGIVYRMQQSRDSEAPTQSNPLYSDQACIIPAGKAVLSDSGTHIDCTLTLRWADKYQLPLARLGDIWQINDTQQNGGAWRGIVKGVSVSAVVDGGVPKVWQSVHIDRYCDV